jgi:hypothetical protein
LSAKGGLSFNEGGKLFPSLTVSHNDIVKYVQETFMIFSKFSSMNSINMVNFEKNKVHKLSRWEEKGSKILISTVKVNGGVIVKTIKNIETETGKKFSET